MVKGFEERVKAINSVFSHDSINDVSDALKKIKEKWAIDSLNRIESMSSNSKKALDYWFKLTREAAKENVKLKDILKLESEFLKNL